MQRVFDYLAAFRRGSNRVLRYYGFNRRHRLIDDDMPGASSTQESYMCCVYNVCSCVIDHRWRSNVKLPGSVHLLAKAREAARFARLSQPIVYEIGLLIRLPRGFSYS